MTTETEFFRAVIAGDIGIVQKAIAEKFDLNTLNPYSSSKETALHIAAFHFHVEMIKILLLNEKIEVDKLNSHGSTPLRNVILRLHSDINEEEVTRCFKIIRLLLKAGANPNYENENGEVVSLYLSAPMRFRKGVYQIFLEHEKVLPNPADILQNKESTHSIKENKEHQKSSIPKSYRLPSLWEDITSFNFFRWSEPENKQNDEATRPLLRYGSKEKEA